jgi:predicted O-linked N-acetylglucosamine transferase (SPINDLY family)
MQIAIESHRAGDLAAAAGIYRQVLARDARHTGAAHLLGIVAYQSGRYDEAIEFISRSISAAPPRADFYSDLGEALRAAGRLEEAVSSYQRAIELAPQYAAAHNNLGSALIAQGKPEEAAASFEQAIRLRPEFAPAPSNLGNALNQLCRFDEAAIHCRSAIAMQPHLAEAHSNLGDALLGVEDFTEAEASYAAALALNPKLAATHDKLGKALECRNQRNEAIDAFRKALELDPHLIAARRNLGAILIRMRHLGEAAALFSAAPIDPAEAQMEFGNALMHERQTRGAADAYARAVELDPQNPVAHNNLGNAFNLMWQLEPAVASYRRAIALKDDFSEAHCNLGNALRRAGRFEEAMASCNQAIELNPDDPRAHAQLGSICNEQGLADLGIEHLERAVSMPACDVTWHNSLVYLLNFSPTCDGDRLLREQRRWNERHAQPLKRHIRPHANDPDPNRRIRVGYVSPNFYAQAESHFVLPLLESHDHDAFEVHCYSSGFYTDEITERHRRCADQWHEILGWDDRETAAQIRGDGIDILIDLTMHMGDSRLLTFARKPAPIQVTWLAYPGGTGMETMDYRLTDRFLDPPELGNGPYAEEAIRLPDWWGCYDPCIDVPPVAPRPAGWNGSICFGSLNNPCKMNPPTVRLWADVLRKIAGSRLILLTQSGGARDRLRREFEAEGVAAERLEFIPHLEREQYLRAFDAIDICLDPLPYNGITTTLDALWMGVPLVSLAGKTAPGRAGLGILNTLGLAELATHTPEDFISVAARLARDFPRLRELRSTLRQRMGNTPLMDGPRFARNIEAAYREMWRRWCHSR